MHFFQLPDSLYFTMDLDARRQSFIDLNPSFGDLEKILLSHGGKRLIYMPSMPDPKFFLKGEVVYPQVIDTLNFTNRCHSASYTISTTQPEIWMWSGFSLSDDGLWRYHSWISTPSKGDEQFIEVTGVHREKCFGIKLTREESDETMDYVKLNLSSCQS